MLNHLIYNPYQVMFGYQFLQARRKQLNLLLIVFLEYRFTCNFTHT